MNTRLPYTQDAWHVTGPNIRNAEGGLIAVVHDLWADETTPDEEKTANAVLIANAPRMFHHLEELVNALSHVKQRDQAVRDAYNAAMLMVVAYHYDPQVVSTSHLTPN